MEQNQLKEAFLNQLFLKGRKATTIQRYHYDLNDFFLWLNDRSFIDLTTKEIESFYQHLMVTRTYQVRTVRRISSVLRRFTLFLVEENVLQDHPLLHHEPPLLTLEPLTREEWISKREMDILLQTTHSEKGLTENQLIARPHLTERNYAILILLTEYGITLSEACTITMNDTSFVQQTLQIKDSVERTVMLASDHSQQLYIYWSSIPEAVRPRLHTSDPLFVAFDFTRRTYHWSYEKDAPKALTAIALQKMIRTEVARSGLRKGISAQHFRNAYLLRTLLDPLSKQDLQQHLGLKSPLSLRRYVLTLAHLTKQDQQALLSSTI
ncbi:tyrosine-type recombinase/integrase [Bacillus sp. Marseille-P3800]|uniref:tyrosine-type recombinase/integrase n=1 Tax=Bacillus sp. Marseille-P3800 TaxID=2014782 RepID=UPI000C0791B0|nr:phage integrase N-terminal SAM-like domain-containing protein [Bacillus sp. Marseille-P3800]